MNHEFKEGDEVQERVRELEAENERLKESASKGWDEAGKCVEEIKALTTRAEQAEAKLEKVREVLQDLSVDDKRRLMNAWHIIHTYFDNISPAKAEPWIALNAGHEAHLSFEMRATPVIYQLQREIDAIRDAQKARA